MKTVIYLHLHQDCFWLFFSSTWWHFRNTGVCIWKVSELKCWVEGIIFLCHGTIFTFPALFTTGKQMFYCFQLFIAEVCQNYYDSCERNIIVVTRDVLNGVRCQEFLPDRVNKAFNYCHLQKLLIASFSPFLGQRIYVH